MAGRKANLAPMWKMLGEKIELEPPEPFHGSTYLGVIQRDVENNDDQIKSKQELMQTLLRLKTQVNQDAEHNYLNLDEFTLDKDRVAGLAPRDRPPGIVPMSTTCVDTQTQQHKDTWSWQRLF